MRITSRFAALWLFVAFQGLYFLTSSGRLRVIDEYSTFFQAESILQRGTTAIPQAVALDVFYGKYGVDGRPYSPYGPGQSILTVPYLLMGRLILRLPGMEARVHDLLLGFSASLLSSTAAAAAVAFLFLAGLNLGYTKGAAALVACVAGLTSPLWTYSGHYFSEPVLAALLAAAILCFLRFLRQRRTSWLVLCSSLLGLAFFTRFAQGALAILAFLLALGLGRGKGEEKVRLKEIAGLLVPFILFAGLYLGFNHSRFGSPLDFGYPDHAEAGKELNRFDTPFFRGLYGLTLSPGKGLFLFAPGLLLSLFSLPSFFGRRRAAGILLVSLLAAYLVFYSPFSQWEGGYCFGPRYLVPIIPLLLLPLGEVVPTPRALREQVGTGEGIPPLSQYWEILTNMLARMPGVRG